MPPLGTLCVELNGVSGTIGIDLHYFNVEGFFKGIKGIPAGMHLFHYSLRNGPVRWGRFVEVKEGQVLSVEYDKSSERFRKAALPDVGEFYKYMVEYPGSGCWLQLTGYIDGDIVDQFCPPEVSTATPLKEENMVLLDVLKLRDPSQRFDSQHGHELEFTILQFDLVQGDRTASLMDKLWYMAQLYEEAVFFGELQLAFVLFVCLGNVCASAQWMSLLKLALMCGRLRGSFYRVFTDLWRRQLETLPREYLEMLDVDALRAICTNMSHLPHWDELEEAVASVGLRVKTPQYADGFEVWDFASDGEYSPAIV